MVPRIADTVYLLECYRVVLLQQPPSLYPGSILGALTSTNYGAEDERRKLLRAMTSRDTQKVSIGTENISIQSLSVLSILASHGRLLPGSLLGPLKLQTGHTNVSSSGWQQEYFELALQRWHDLHTTPPTYNARLLFHLIHLSFYCSFTEIEREARASLETKRSREHQVSESTQNNTTSTSRLDSARATMQRCFQSQENMEKSRWHACRILDTASHVELASVSHPHGKVHLRQEASKARHGEPIYFPHAIYHSAMVIYLSSTLQETLPELNLEEQLGGILVASAAQKAMSLLSRSASRVSGVFKKVLESLQQLK